MSDLTARQRDALVWLGEHSSSDMTRYQFASPAALARHLWPDSPAWGRRTRHYGSNHPGQAGGTMPMNAAKILHRLAAAGLAHDHGPDFGDYVSRWAVTTKGEQWLAEYR